MIEARNISKSFVQNGVAALALNDVSLTVDKGEFVAIIGRSGSGKSTMLNVLSTLLEPDSGSIIFDGREITNLGEKARNTLRHQSYAVIFQFHHLMPYLTAVENVLLPYMNGIAPVSATIRQRALACLERVGLAGKERSLPGELSGGEQQRVAIARALVREADVLFADEPTGSLDSATGEEIMSLLADLNNEGLTIIMVTHNEEYASRAGRIIRMQDGAVVS